ncbi:uncharacterized protein LOC106079477 isoform X2 [Biomphalaria glabrata]|uniref:Uncharacterized protein LOC106079477 isoform X2 n=1 Tax=Biomphalaria glabrata TaxID=6526 RepID=A0A9U8ENA9_BIOGL|nr:uncharacterized protein LOC106079477 isoform X2 [Biomphalaria glabrata]
MARLKLLYELEFRELKQELRDRDLKTSGNKETLQARLRDDILEEKEDPDTYLFEVEPNLLEQINSKLDAMNTKIAAMNQRIPAVEERIINSDVRSDAKTRERSLGGDHEDPLKPDEAVERHMQVERYQPGPNLTDVGPAAKTREESPDGGKENPRQSDVDVDGHLKDECHRQGLKPTSDWPDTETRERGPDGGEESRMEPEAEDEGPFHEECYQPAPRACPPDKAEDDDLSHNSPPCGFEAHPSPSSQSPMKPPLLPTILVSPALTSYTSPCVKWLSSVPTDKRAMQPQRHCNKRAINWMKRRRRRLRSPTCMVILPRNNCSHMKTNWRRRRRRLLLLSATWMTMRQLH